MKQEKQKAGEMLGTAIAGLDRQALCELVIALCRKLTDEVGPAGWHGGIYPENISRLPDGSLAIGEGKSREWDSLEKRFVPPELYWSGECGPAGDVYSLGLLLWYGLSGGRLPAEGESPDAQLSRMNGKDIPAPEGCGPRLGEIIEKALRFHQNERYENPQALAVVLDSCLDNKYLDPEEDGASLFQKQEGELNDAERMLLEILGDSGREKSAEEPIREPETPASVSIEEAAELILGENAPEKPAEPEQKEDLQALVEEVFGEAEPEVPPVPDEPEDVRVYEPGKDKKEAGKAEAKEGIPILTVEENPELAPVVPKKTAVRYSRDETRSREIAAEVKKRRTRPIGVVLILCGLLIIAALIANHFLQDYEWKDEGRGRDVSMPEVGENAISKEGGFISVEEYEQEQQEQQEALRQSYYQVFPGDISWTAAKNAAADRGGMLAVVNSADEFTMITQLAQQSGMQGVWIGCHREGNYLVWETEEPTAMMSWADNEPSYTDSRDGAAEDFIMLWNTGSGWACIDCRNDPVAADPNIYSGRIGYVCEFVN